MIANFIVFVFKSVHTKQSLYEYWERSFEELCYRISIFNLFWIAVTVKEEGRNKEQGRKREGKKRISEGRRNEWSERHIEVLTGTNTNRVASLLKILKKGGMFIFLTFATSLILTDILEIV